MREPDWDNLSTDELARIAAMHSRGATKRLERIELALTVIALMVAAMLGKTLGWY